MPHEIDFKQFFETLQSNHAFNHEDRIVILELSDNHFELVVLEFSKWRSGFNYPLIFYMTDPEWNNISSKKEDASLLSQEIESFLATNDIPNNPVPKHIILIGNLAIHDGVRTGVETYFSTHDIQTDAELHFPRQGEKLKSFLRGQPLIAPYSLSLCALELQPDEKLSILQLMPFLIFKQWDVLNNQVIKEIVFHAPVLNAPFLLVLREENEDGDFIGDRILVVRSDQESNRIRFLRDDRRGYTCQLNENCVFIDEWRLPEPLDPPAIEIQSTYHSLAIVIESTMGIYAEDAGKKELLTHSYTTFENVYELYGRILDSVRSSETIHYRTVFYGDYDHPVKIPHNKKQLDVISFPNHSSSFVEYESLNAALSKEIFHEQQTYSLDWQKCAEAATQHLTELNWDNSAQKIVLWIVQCPPHLAQDSQEEAIYAYRSQISFWEMYQNLNDQGVRHIVLFVGNDINNIDFDKNLYQQARAHWHKVGETGLYFREINLSLVDENVVTWVSTKIDNLTHARRGRKRVIFAFPPVHERNRYYWALIPSDILNQYEFHYQGHRR